jgi:hypothetical protein
MKVAKAKGRLRGKQPKLKPAQEAHLVELWRASASTPAPSSPNSCPSSAPRRTAPCSAPASRSPRELVIHRLLRPVWPTFTNRSAVSRDSLGSKNTHRMTRGVLPQNTPGSLQDTLEEGFSSRETEPIWTSGGRGHQFAGVRVRPAATSGGE